MQLLVFYNAAASLYCVQVMMCTAVVLHAVPAGWWCLQLHQHEPGKNTSASMALHGFVSVSKQLPGNSHACTVLAARQHGHMLIQQR